MVDQKLITDYVIFVTITLFFPISCFQHDIVGIINKYNGSSVCVCMVLFTNLVCICMGGIGSAFFLVERDRISS